METKGRIRIIAGQWRRRLLPVPSHPQLRPSPDRVRETLFNWIGDDIHGSSCVDLFAGSGALGFEAASRGAGRVWMVEADAALYRNLEAQKRVLDAGQVDIAHADAWAWCARTSQAVDYVFLDPPFGAHDFDELTARLEASRLIKPSTILYYECALAAGRRLGDGAPGDSRAWQAFWQPMHCARAGRVSYNLFRRQHPETEFPA